jgi:hypothetical protein
VEEGDPLVASPGRVFAKSPSKEKWKIKKILNLV